MPRSQEAAQTGHSLWKIALAVALTLTFVVVLIVQFGGGSCDKKSCRPQNTETDRAKTSRRKKIDDVAGESLAEVQAVEQSTPCWPTLDPTDVLRHDPFTVPATFSRGLASEATTPESGKDSSRRREELMRKRAQREQALAKLRQEGIKAVLGGNANENVAVIGSRIVRVGDELDGFRITAIETDGVVLEQPPIK